MTAALGTPSGYFTDMLFRTETSPAAGAAPADTRDSRAEASRIVLRSIGGDMSADDKAYLARLVAAQTGLSPDEAAKRVDAVNAQVKAAQDKVKDTADKARKAAATASFFAFLSLLIGAFIASVAAAFGGSQRDEYEAMYLQAR
jgi:VIT1/CCC1 family predicted Fe2+/Mn2+ transporter